MKPPTHSEVSLASGVLRLLDANEGLERSLVDAAKSASSSHRIEVRETGESIYRLLDTLNSQLEPFSSPGALARPGAKLELRQHVTRGEHRVARKSKPLRVLPGLASLQQDLDEWTETYLDFACAIGRSLDPEPRAEHERRDAA